MSTINFSGIASGIDSSSLIKALLDQKRKAQITPLETKISALGETNSSFSELSDLLNTLKTSAAKFRQINGGVLSKTLSSSDESKVSGSANNAAANGTYSVNVTALAKNGTHSFNDRFASETTVINSNINDADPAANRTLSYTIGTGGDAETVDVVLTSTTTLANLVSQFNSQSNNATASVVNVGTSASPSYAFVVNSDNQGLSKGNIAVSVGSSITDPNGDLSTLDGSFVTSTVSAATDAEFSVSGVSGSITRSSNSVTDVISGVNLNLQSLGTSNITVADDGAKTASSLQEFVDAYNDVIKYISDNDTVTRDESGDEVTNVFGPLANSSLDEGILSTLRTALGDAGVSGRTVNILADLGITTKRDGTLDFNSDTFKSALANDSEGVRLITESLGDDLSSVDGKIARYTRFNGLIDLEKNANSQNITDTNKRVSDLESMLGREEESLTSRFSRLEALIGQLNSQQTTLASILPR
jgi:flagellar hook-associated protein 2